MSVSEPARPRDALHALYACRLWTMGKQLVFPLYTAIIRELGARSGDLVLVRVHLPFVTFRIANPDLTMRIPRFEADDLPPTYKELLLELHKAVK